MSELFDHREIFDGDGRFRYGSSAGAIRHDNARRAGFAAVAVLFYAVRTGLLGRSDDEDVTTALSDLLGDLRHLADDLDADFSALDATGFDHYHAELLGEV